MTDKTATIPDLLAHQSNPFCYSTSGKTRGSAFNIRIKSIEVACPEGEVQRTRIAALHQNE
jgi:hypothetical protein